MKYINVLFAVIPHYICQSTMRRDISTLKRQTPDREERGLIASIAVQNVDNFIRLTSPLGLHASFEGTNSRWSFYLL